MNISTVETGSTNLTHLWIVDFLDLNFVVLFERFMFSVNAKVQHTDTGMTVCWIGMRGSYS
jgi:hypothetical protein